MKPVQFVLLSIFCLFLHHTLPAQDDFYNVEKIQEISLFFGYSNWDYRLDTAKAGKENYIIADYCLINGVRYDSVGVKYKGNSSYNAGRIKNPLHIKLDFVKNQDYQNYESIKLGNNFSDPSAIREVISYQILSQYMDCSVANFARVYINGSLIGLYTNVETVNKKFCSEHFGSSDHVFVKGNPDRPGNNSTSNLKFNTYDSSKYLIYYGMENTVGWYKLIALMDSLRIKTSNIPKIVDVDRSLWMHAFNNVMSNYDSYTGSFSQNYYLYEDDYGRFLPIIWDLNMSFGGFPGSGSSVDKLSILYQSTNADRPLISSLLSNATYKRMYLAHLKTIAEENFTGNGFETNAKYLQSIVDTLVKNDPNNLTTYAQFQTSLTAAISGGGGPGGSSPGLLTLQTARLAYYKTTPEFNYIAPTIGNYTADIQNRFVGDSIWVSVKLSNQNNAFVGFRKNKYSPFVYQTLYDDGLHQDGIAGDSIYGTYIIAQTRKTQFYIYAENNSIGLFSPRRAEFEYHTLEVNEKLTDIQKGDVVINEFMSSNQSTVLDTTDDKFEDWIELYNNTNQTVDLSKLFLTDDDSNMEKFEFPSGISIPAKGRLIVWCDEDSQTPSGVHANFKLSASGEQLIFTRQDGLVLDSIRFGAIPTDQSMERCPDGTGLFKITSKPTFNLPNCGIVANEVVKPLSPFYITPNPAHHYFEIINPDGKSIRDITIYNQLGQTITRTVGNKVDVSNWQAGIYFIVFVDTSLKSYNLKLIKE